ncbi:hypothetical protein PoB_005758000 [Plakobranchus ocellatus]|uniref:Uncharacterized protein n=1 Tax=Plakobranchus ocellatus TaxID=259542 RepID=A0AAV4CE64_9GAST|nr:hypothetical protein PoB_005758000 [Plakobranchus ocellatus]
MLTFTPSGQKIRILRGQTSSMQCSPTWEKTSSKEVKEQAENRRRRTASLTEKLPFLIFFMPPFAAGLPRVGEGHGDSKVLPTFDGLDIVMRANATSLRKLK